MKSLLGEPRISKHDIGSKETFFLAYFKEWHNTIRRKMPRVSTGQSSAPRSLRVTTTVTHSKMEMEGYQYGFHYGFMKEKEA